MTTVSVIMPVYNAERYIEQAINSVLNQTYQDFELIIVNDQSSDKSVTICQRFQDPRIRIINQHHLGMAGARNTGVLTAKGTLIAFLDAFHYWAPEKLQMHVEHLQEHPKVGVSFSPSLYVDEDGQLFDLRPNPKLQKLRLEDIFCQNPVGNASAAVIRKEVLEEIALKGHSLGVLRRWYFDETFKQMEDYDCWLRIASHTVWRFAGIEPALTFTRENDQVQTANYGKPMDSWKRAAKKLLVIEPQVYFACSKLSEAYQLRYLARCELRARNKKLALKLIRLAINSDYRIILQEPACTLKTLICADLINMLPQSVYCKIEKAALAISRFFGNLTVKKRIKTHVPVV